MTQAILPGDPPIPILLRRSGRARRISLRVSRLDGRVTLSLPNWTPETEAMDFARQKEPWIRQNLAQQAQAQTPGIGGVIPFRGMDVPIIAGRVRSAKLQDGAMIVPPRDAMVPARVAAFLKLQARVHLTDASVRYARALGVDIGRITLRDTRSRWGSCSADGNLMYSWRLIMAPAEVLAYVAAHEVAHRVEMNHSAAFWDVVQSVFPEHAATRTWLRTDGHALHRWNFK
ncbi:M48 family metallopeptidase [Aliiroseovarius sp. PTFE2010]|uniref:M48 family metallopeptidase n=1 Tax=Aliiroseovarius sp. PTFE2010 TaxID=3417190 RepID=UPI003CF91E04